MKMKGYAMLGIGRTGWIEKEVPACGPLDAIVRPIAVSPLHLGHPHGLGGRHRRTLGHDSGT